MPKSTSPPSAAENQPRRPPPKTLTRRVNHLEADKATTEKVASIALDKSNDALGEIHAHKDECVEASKETQAAVERNRLGIVMVDAKVVAVEAKVDLIGKKVDALSEQNIKFHRELGALMKRDQDEVKAEETEKLRQEGRDELVRDIKAFCRRWVWIPVGAFIIAIGWATSEISALSQTWVNLHSMTTTTTDSVVVKSIPGTKP